ncbi:MAG: crossover junction endodeoxyribonuclease RuvC [Acidimicrobiia bacterium]|nr:crossover junction endodeoxyribonuclease RuvC [Acidimicrobiia bacterium]
MFDSKGIVLGVDPGLSHCGYGAIRRAPSGPESLAYGEISTDPASDVAERLLVLADELTELIEGLAPTVLVVERILFQNNAKTAISVGQASGVVLLTAARVGIPVVIYSPNEVKLAVTGSGAAPKRQVQLMVTRLLNLEAVPGSPDAADALALALCHLQSAHLRSLGDATKSAPGLVNAISAALARESAS